MNIPWDIVITCVGFNILALLSLAVPELRHGLTKRNRSQWFIDIQGLLAQGLLIPLAKVYGLVFVLATLIPSWQQALHLPSWAGFALAFIGVDYLYYWNHRLLHSRWLWPMHMVHHSAQSLDIFATARNSFWSPLFLCYLWVHSFFAFVLSDPFPYLIGATLTAVLDLWRHSPGLEPLPKMALLICPNDHSWHHSIPGMRRNFGANFRIWDQLHGTYEEPDPAVKRYGWFDQRSLWRQWLAPWKPRRNLSTRSGRTL